MSASIFVVLLLSVLSSGCNPEESVGDVGLTTSTEVLLNGQLPGEAFGSAVDFLGDINGDGEGDIAVGAPLNTEGGVAAGAVYLYFGPLSADSEPTKITGLSGERLGSGVVGLGDLDGDGLGELLLSAPGKNRAYLFKGTATTGVLGDAPLTTQKAQITFTGNSSGLAGVTINNFATSISRGGDINRDGKLDLAIAATTSNGAGWVGIYLGGQGVGVLDAALQFTLDAAAAELKIVGASGEALGTSLAVAGDPNGDFGAANSAARLFGDDLLVGMPSGEGAALLLMGVDGVSGNFTSSNYPKRGKLTADGKSGFGNRLSGTGDLTGDGLDDFAVAFDGGLAIYPGFLQTGFISSQKLLLLGDGSGDDFAAALAGGRGFLPSSVGLMAGAPNNSFNGIAGGVAYLFDRPGLADFFSIQSTLFATPTAAALFRGLNHTPLVGRRLGAAVAFGGDCNGDQAADALIGMPSFDGTGLGSGAVLLEF